MRRFFPFFLFLLVLNVQAQTFDNFLFQERSDIRKQMKALEGKNNKFQVNVRDSANTLLIDIKGFEQISIVCTFDEDSLCEESIFNYTCGDCFDKHFHEFLTDGYYGWVEASNGEYFSKYKRHEVMSKRKSPEENFCNRLVFYAGTWTKEQYHEKLKR